MRDHGALEGSSSEWDVCYFTSTGAECNFVGSGVYKVMLQSK